MTAANSKIPPDAFTFYVSLGPARSYEAVAEKYGVTKRGIEAHAKRERWQERVAEADRRAREKADAKAQESLQEMRERHIKEAQFLQSKALEGLRSGRHELIGPCGKALQTGMQMECLSRGQATERTESSVEAIIKRQYERWLKPVDGGDAAETDDDDEGEDEADGAAA